MILNFLKIYYFENFILILYIILCMSAYNTANTIPTKYQIFYSIIWMIIILPIKGFFNPLSFLDSSFVDKFDNNKLILSTTIGNKLIFKSQKKI